MYKKTINQPGAGKWYEESEWSSSPRVTRSHKYYKMKLKPFILEEAHILITLYYCIVQYESTFKHVL